MAKKSRSAFVCQACGTHYAKWQGRCASCNAWDTIVEETTSAAPDRTSEFWTGPAVRPKRLDEIADVREARIPLPDVELNRALDGGLAVGSVVLLGGEPGIGKSTLLLQLALQLEGRLTLYVSGEESERQVKLRAQRLPITNDALFILAATRLGDILDAAREMEPELLVVDSIQTVYTEDLEAAPGSVSQVRECAARLMRFAKDTHTTVVMVGHVNKEGALAGPKTLEHIVDTVLEFEGDRRYNYRIVRSVKNRFGATPELAVYEMAVDGLRPVLNPSALFMSQNPAGVSGVALAATMEGARPIIIEVQALVADATYSAPTRSATGFDQRRLQMLLAVLEKKSGLKLGMKDVYVNLAGGIRIDDPALDLAICAAVVSSLFDTPISPKTVFAAEVALTGELRPVARMAPRLAESAKLGFETAIISGDGGAAGPATPGLSPRVNRRLDEVFRLIFG